MEVRKIDVKGWSITSQKSFESVVASVEAQVGEPNMTDFGARIAGAKTYTEVQDVVSRAVGKSGLMEFMRIDAGAVLAKAGGKPAKKEDPMSTDVLTTRVADGIAVITLGSAKRIYFDAEMGDALTDVWTDMPATLAFALSS